MSIIYLLINSIKNDYIVGKAHFVSKTAVLEAGNDAEDCGLPIWRAGGWISGDKNLNNKGPNATSDLYSYDVFNLMIDRLMDTCAKRENASNKEKLQIIKENATKQI